MGYSRISCDYALLASHYGLNIGKLEELEGVKASIPVGKWNAQYMQNPTAEEGAIIKREWWQNMGKRRTLRPVNYIIQSYDTAFSKSDRADYSAVTTWGIFVEPDTNEEAYHAFGRC